MAITGPANISGPYEVEFVTDYLRPLCEATLDFQANYLRPFSKLWTNSIKNPGSTASIAFSDAFTAGFSADLVNDGFSGSPFFRLTGNTVFIASKLISDFSSEIDSELARITRIAGRNAFTTESFDISRGSTGTGWSE